MIRRAKLILAVMPLSLSSYAHAEDPDIARPMQELRLSPEFWRRVAQEKRDLDLLGCWSRCAPPERRRVGKEGGR